MDVDVIFKLNYSCKASKMIPSKIADIFNEYTVKIPSHQTADNPRPMPTNFYWLVGYDRVKKNIRSDWRAYLSPINTRCISVVSLMHQRSNPALPDLHLSFWPTNPRSARPTPTYSWYNYAHYAQYWTNPRFVCLISTPGLKK